MYKASLLLYVKIVNKIKKQSIAFVRPVEYNKR